MSLTILRQCEKIISVACNLELEVASIRVWGAANLSLEQRSLEFRVAQVSVWGSANASLG